MNQVTPEMEQRFSDWQRGLTTDRRNQTISEVAERQQELIEAVKGGSSSFAGYLRNALGIGADVELSAPSLPRKIDPSEFRNPPLQLELDLFATWSGRVRPREASQPLLWTQWHLQWIGEGQFGERLDDALLGTLTSGADEQTTEASARNLLRRLGGLPHVRGKVSVLTDCPLSRAWWRGHSAASTAEFCDGAFDAATAHRVLHSSNGAWAKLVEDSVRRITVMNHSGLRAALVNEYRSASRDGAPVPTQEMQTAVRLLARRGPSIALGALSWTQLCQETAAAVAEAKMHQSEASSIASYAEDSASSASETLPQLSRFLRRVTGQPRRVVDR